MDISLENKKKKTLRAVIFLFSIGFMAAVFTVVNAALMVSGIDKSVAPTLWWFSVSVFFTVVGVIVLSECRKKYVDL